VLSTRRFYFTTTLKNKQERNRVIALVYLEDGYSQIEIANYLGLSKSAVSMIIKSGDSTAGVYI